MLKNNKLKILLSSLLTLSPILLGLILWDKLPNTMSIHWGADGVADGFGSKAIAVFLLPSILFALNLLCMLVTALDKKQAEQNKKALNLIFWIMPVISISLSGTFYSIFLNKEFDITILLPILFGLMFLSIGNYLPKIKQNQTLGIKLPWTIYNEENWNKTHRFGGKVWAICGIIILLSVFLPMKISIYVFVLTLILAIILPTVYSYKIYKEHKKTGISYAVPKTHKKASLISAIIATAVLISAAVFMFTGNINIKFFNNTFKIEATYFEDLEVSYDKIDSVEYSENFDIGVRTYGFGSARLSMGNFKNNDIGEYTLYAYTSVKEKVLIKSNGKTLVINGKTTDDTKKIYEEMNRKIS